LTKTGNFTQVQYLAAGYNIRMTRAALFALLVGSVLDGSVHAQRAAAGFHGNSSAGLSVRSGFVGPRAFPSRFFSSRSHIRHDRFGSAFFSYDEPFGYAQTDAETVTEEAAPLILRPDKRPSRELEPPAPKPLVIEIPAVANSREPRIQPPTIFVLENGERVETRRFVLTASVLSFSVDRQQRAIPFDLLDINATISANHERGIDLRIPADRNEISLSF
jgi:hypothetical protein